MAVSLEILVWVMLVQECFVALLHVGQPVPAQRIFLIVLIQSVASINPVLVRQFFDYKFQCLIVVSVGVIQVHVIQQKPYSTRIRIIIK